MQQVIAVNHQIGRFVTRVELKDVVDDLASFFELRHSCLHRHCLINRLDVLRNHSFLVHQRQIISCASFAVADESVGFQIFPPMFATHRVRAIAVADEKLLAGRNGPNDDKCDFVFNRYALHHRIAAVAEKRCKQAQTASNRLSESSSIEVGSFDPRMLLHVVQVCVQNLHLVSSELAYEFSVTVGLQQRIKWWFCEHFVHRR